MMCMPSGLSYRLYRVSLANTDRFTRGGAYRLEIISALVKGLVNLADTTCSADLQIL